MGLPKALLRAPDGTAWVSRAARVLLDGGCRGLVVVVGASADEVAPLVPEGAVVVVARDWAEGMGASLRAGLAAVPAESDAVLVGLVDTPGVTPEVVSRLVAAARPDVLARACYDGRPGHPVLIGSEHWGGAAAEAHGDTGARGYLATRDVMLVECQDVGDGRDADLPSTASDPPSTVSDRLAAVSDPPSTVGDRPAHAGLTGRGSSLYPGSVSTQARPEPTQPHPALDPGADHGDHGHAGSVDSTRVRPPARSVAFTALTDQPLDAAAHERAVADASAGAVVTFRGLVRDHDGGRPVTAIEYVAHPSAASVLAELAAEVVARTDCEAVAITHRVGQLWIGDDAIVVSVSAAHRHEAFAAAATIVDEVKHRLPVWKRQQFPDGTDEWVACP